MKRRYLDPVRPGRMGRQKVRHREDLISSTVLFGHDRNSGYIPEIVSQIRLIFTTESDTAWRRVLIEKLSHSLPRLLWNMKLYDRVHKTPRLAPYPEPDESSPQI